MSCAERARSARRRAVTRSITETAFMFARPAAIRSTAPKPSSTPAPVGRVSFSRSAKKRSTKAARLSDLWSGDFMRTLRLASRTCLQRWTAANGIALLHERRRAEIPRSVIAGPRIPAVAHAGQGRSGSHAPTTNYARICSCDFCDRREAESAFAGTRFARWNQRNRCERQRIRQLRIRASTRGSAVGRSR